MHLVQVSPTGWLTIAVIELPRCGGRQPPGVMAAYAACVRLHHGVEFHNELPAPSDGELRAVEDLRRVHLPLPYVDLLRVAHGAETDARTAMPDRPLPVCFGSWLSLPDAVSARESYRDSYFCHQLPEEFLPVALTGAEDDFILIRLDNAYGEVWAWMSGRPPGWHRPTEDAFLRLAADLDAYLSSLLPPESDDA